MSTTTKFVSIPVEVTAMQLAMPDDALAIAQWLGVEVHRRYKRTDRGTELDHAALTVGTRDFELRLGDWLVRGANGLFQLEDDSFTARYRRVTAGS